MVTPELKTRYDGYFQGIDKDHDGYVSGEEARSLFMASNLQQHVLAHIWWVGVVRGGTPNGWVWSEVRPGMGGCG